MRYFYHNPFFSEMQELYLAIRQKIKFFILHFVRDNNIIDKHI